MFQARHMEAIATELRILTLDLSPKDSWKVTKAFHDMLARSNPAFKSERFLKACEMPK